MKRDQALNALGDPDEGTEGDQFGDLPPKPPARPDGVGEFLERVRLCRLQGQPGLSVPRVELKEHTGHTLPDLDDIRNGLEASPGQFGYRDEPDAGEDRMVGPSSNATNTPKRSIAVIVPERISPR